MKVVIVIVLSVLLVLSVGLLAYGSTLSNKVTFDPDLGDLLPPVAPDEYAHDIALWIEANLTAELAYSLGSVSLFGQYHYGYDEALCDCIRGIRPVPYFRIGVLFGDLF